MNNAGFNIVNDINEINRLAAENTRKFIDDCEGNYKRSVNNISDVLATRNGRTIVLLAGPSGSGKTTTSHKIMSNLNCKGIDSVVISLDNFYKGKNDAPLLEDGSRDYETIYALNVPVLQLCLKDIIFKGSCRMPEFDFNTGAPKKELLDVSLGKDGVVILEGIHALNPLISDALEEVSPGNIVKIYISVGTGIYDGEQEIISARDIRLARRMTRDFTHRAASPQLTLHMWTNVVAGEIKYLEPYADTADFYINSFHAYEPCVFKENTEPLLEKVAETDENYESAHRVYKFLSKVVGISEDNIPDDSLLNEFIVVESRN